MEGFIQPEFGVQFSRWHHGNARNRDLCVQREIPVTQYACLYCSPFEYVITDRIIHNENAHNSLQNPILTEIIRAIWGVSNDQKNSE